MITLFKYQDKFVGKIKKALKEGFLHLICQSPTGSGKTIMFSWIAFKAANKDKKILILTDRIELLTQAGGTVEKFDFYPYYIKAGAKYIDRDRDIYIAMSQTLRNRIKIDNWRDFIENEIDIIIIDEAHVQEFNYLFESGLVDKKPVLGFTATPARTGKMRQLGLDYNKIIYGPSVKELIEKERLVNCDIYDLGSPDLSGLAINHAKGDYAEGALFDRFNKAKLYKGLVKNYKKVTAGQKMIVFCCNVEHAIKTTKELNKAGLNAKFICAKKSPPKKPKNQNPAAIEAYKTRLKVYKLWKKNYEKYSGTRKAIFEGFNNTDFDILVNVDIATKGYDCPDIEVVALYRATMSLPLYLQMIGRGGRTSPGKTHFTVFDFGGNKERFGGYDIERNWSLWHEQREGSGVPPLKECGVNNKLGYIEGAGDVKRGCNRLILASAKICSYCGFKYPEKDEAKEIELMLAEIKDENGVSIKEKSFDEMSFEELHKYRAIKKHKMAWLWRQLWNRDEEETIIEFAKKYKWGQAQTKRAIEYCKIAFS